jgi:hypothetical protein
VMSTSRLSQPDVSPLERETVRRLRTESGWWNGDKNAVEVLRSFAAKVNQPQAKETQPCSQPST